ncbi:MAG: methyltransferase domain-containing protein [Actinobacteria bacterium]|nr:methyltransferase domain-containing protein [Actinomycetota bacterium]
MIHESLERLSQILAEDDLVLDVGGWARPFSRADLVLDQMPYETRGLYGHDGEGPERFDASSWIQRDICAREPWPFSDNQIDFAICSQTLEDVRDPLWVCAELVRVAKAGYIEVPSRLEEQTYGIQGPWVGWGHHRWLVDISDRRIEFVFKHHIIHGKPAAHFPATFAGNLKPAERVQSLWWKGTFEFSERTFQDPQALDDYLSSFVSCELQRRGFHAQLHPRATRWRSRAAGTLSGKVKSKA